MAPDGARGQDRRISLFEILPGIDFAFRADALGMVFATVSSLLWIVASVYSIGYMRHLHEHAQTRFFACFAASLAAAVGGAFSANLFTLVIFYEALTLVTYPLVYHHEDEEAWAGAANTSSTSWARRRACCLLRWRYISPRGIARFRAGRAARRA